MKTFNEIKKAVVANFKALTQQPSKDLYYVTIDRDVIWDKYLDGFDDPDIKQDHNCNCCKSFLRQYGGVCAIVDYKVVSIWDGIEVEGYEQSIKNLQEYVHSLPITDVFITDEANCGTDRNHSIKHDCNFSHFHFKAPAAYVKSKSSIPTLKGKIRTLKETSYRAYTELKLDAVETVIEIIEQGSLYRGAEHKDKLVQFVKEMKNYNKIPADEQELYCWISSSGGIAPHIRNSAIGTLLVDLSDGMDLEQAVRRYESVVAPHNYKRPKSLVTPKMIEDAKEKLNELGLLGSLERRFAQETDLDISNILYTDNSSQLTDVFGEMSKDVLVNSKKLTKVESVTMEEFLNNVVPSAKSIEMLLENSQLNNLFSLVTAKDSDTPSLFKWNNHFSWNYTGGITDAITERVKAAGGNVDGVLRSSLSWSNYDDLDIHVFDPCGAHIYYSSKRAKSTGTLDVDMNAGGPKSRTPVENVVWTDPMRMVEGHYRISVHNYSKRESEGQGYTIQLACNGEIHEFHKERNPNGQQMHDVVEFDWSREGGITNISAQGKSSVESKEKWGLETCRYHKVRKVFLSPNHWNGNPTGNKHYLFALEGCVSDENVRPIFNEFLSDELHQHRKVFEVLGGKLKLEEDENQISGVGFSETQDNQFFARVRGKFERIIKVTI